MQRWRERKRDKIKERVDGERARVRNKKGRWGKMEQGIK